MPLPFVVDYTEDELCVTDLDLNWSTPAKVRNALSLCGTLLFALSVLKKRGLTWMELSWNSPPTPQRWL